MAHECTDQTSRRAEIPPPEESTKGSGRRKIFSLKTKVLCPAAASGGFARPKIWSRSKLVKRIKILKVLRMGLPIVENLSGLQESIFSLSRSPQLHFDKKSKNDRIILNFLIFPYSPCLGSLGLLLSWSGSPLPSWVLGVGSL